LARPSDDGGFDEFLELSPNRRSNSATRAVNAAICSACATTKTASSSYDGRREPDDTPEIIHLDHHNQPTDTHHLNSYEEES
jgi:hypothetical protein